MFVDATGKEVSVPKKEIVERRESQLSLMPSNFGEARAPQEFYDLLAFLLAHGATWTVSAKGSRPQFFPSNHFLNEWVD